MCSADGVIERRQIAPEQISELRQFPIDLRRQLLVDDVGRIRGPRVRAFDNPEQRSQFVVELRRKIQRILGRLITVLVEQSFDPG